MNAERQMEHQWLERFVGDWTYEIESSAGPEGPPTKDTGTESVRSLGGLWIVCEGQGQLPDGGTQTTIMTLGYDPARQRVVGTFIGTMMTHLWIYDGALDPAGKVLTLNSEGPSFSDDGNLAKYRDTIEFRSDYHRVLTSNFQGKDGAWQAFMTANYRRTKK